MPMGTGVSPVEGQEATETVTIQTVGREVATIVEIRAAEIDVDEALLQEMTGMTMVKAAVIQTAGLEQEAAVVVMLVVEVVLVVSGKARAKEASSGPCPSNRCAPEGVQRRPCAVLGAARNPALLHQLARRSADESADVN